MAFHDSLATSLLVVSIASLLFIPSYGLSEAEALLNFKKSLVVGGNDVLSTWNQENPPCNGKAANWAGVMCSRDSVWGLQLENKDLSGTFDVDALNELPNLRTLSFMNNKFGGPLPKFNKLGALKSLYLSNNQFEGEIPGDEFKGLLRMKKIYLANNKFTGEIPVSLAALPKLLEMRLDGNQFSGRIPDFKHKLQVLDVSNNALTGPIPAALATMDPKVFAGNKGLCGKPLNMECDSSKAANIPNIGSSNATAPTASSDVTAAASSDVTADAGSPDGTNHEDSKKSSSKTLIIIGSVIAAVVVLLLILGAIVMLTRRKKPAMTIESTPSNLQKKSGIRDVEQSPQSGRGRSPPDYHSSSTNNRRVAAASAADSTKLTFVRDDREKFDLPDLLKASAEILGSGCFGSSYKAALVSGAVMVVKRFKQMNNVGREDFQEHMRRIGRLQHKHLLPLVAYYYRKEEKLLVCDFVEKGSLAVHLHGNQSLGQPSLDWPTRLRIVKGVARGLQYLYKELPSLIAPHGHLKSSNVLLSKNFEPLLTDYGLIPVINQESAQELMGAYKSPEYLQHSRITKKTDVWELGTIILEILTGKFPANFLKKGKGNEDDLASWVKSVFNGEWTSEVFDKDMGKPPNSEGEMVKLLKIGLSCCEADTEKRWDIKEAVERIEEVKERDGDEDFYSTYASEADGKSSRGVSSEFISLS